MKKLFRALVLCVLLLGLLPLSAEAGGVVTDTLTVKVGYYGMAAEKYVEAGTYHWTELSENLELYDKAYTFYRPGEDGVYRVVVDSARGFHIDDLLEYARINVDNVQSLNFYTRDQSVGAFTSFTWSELFRPRYYFDNLPKHIQIGDAWSFAQEVEPMLALEDSWVTYEVGTENVYPDFDHMGTGNRFRLLFGQTEPTESRTNQSAKYVHTVYVTLQGAPKVVKEPQALDGTIGSHTAQLTLSIDDPSLLEHLMDLLEFTSSDGTVLRIDGWTVTPDSRYSDLVTISIQYTVLKEGSASISGSVAGVELSAKPGIEMPDTPDVPDNPTDPDDTGESGESGDPGQDGTSPETPDSVPDNGGTNRDTERILDQWASQVPSAPKNDEIPLPEGRVMIPLTAQQAAQLINGSGKNPESDNQDGSDSTPEEKQDDLRWALVMTGIGALLLAAAGSAAQTVYYRKERKA